MELVYFTKEISPKYYGKPKNKIYQQFNTITNKKTRYPNMEMIITKTQKENN